MNAGYLEVDSLTRSHERRQMMVKLLERKIRLRADQIYKERGQEEGRALEDWITAESEVLQSSILAPLWNKQQARKQSDQQELIEA
jgi:hypothetical protein